MTLSLKNQNDILNLENLNSNEIEYIFNDKPINRIKAKPQLEDKKKLLLELVMSSKDLLSENQKNPCVGSVGMISVHRSLPRGCVTRCE